MLSQISVSVASGNFSVVSSFHFIVLYIITCYIFYCITPNYGPAYTDTTLKMLTSEQETMLSTPLDFPTGKRVTDHCFILMSEAVGFSQELLPP